MPHWKLTLSYNGAAFHGWQVQPGLPTAQGRLAEALREITGEAVLPQGSGRTDAGVHALAQVTSFSLATTIPPGNLQRALNRLLPPSIRVICAELAPANFHARHSARRKTYEYRLFPRQGLPKLRSLCGSEESEKNTEGDAERICSPFLAPFVWDCRWPLDLPTLQGAAEMCIGTHDFTSMAARGRSARETSEESEGSEGQGQGQDRPNPVKTIFSSDWRAAEGLLVYRICGSGFLHHMVRNLVGTMVDIGRGSRKLEDFSQILSARDRSQAGPTAPASGLYLVGVEYDEHPEGEELQGPAWSSRKGEVAIGSEGVL